MINILYFESAKLHLFQEISRMQREKTSINRGIYSQRSPLPFLPSPVNILSHEVKISLYNPVCNKEVCNLPQ